MGGKQFIIDARKIIGSDVVVLFLCYNIKHLDWIKNFKNALFSNDVSFYEDYLNCFINEKEHYEDEEEDDNDDSNDSKDEIDEQKIIREIKDLRDMIENTYRVKLNFDNNFLYYPKFKNEGKFSDLEL